MFIWLFCIFGCAVCWRPLVPSVDILFVLLSLQFGQRSVVLSNVINIFDIKSAPAARLDLHGTLIFVVSQNTVDS